MQASQYTAVTYNAIARLISQPLKINIMAETCTVHNLLQTRWIYYVNLMYIYSLVQKKERTTRAVELASLIRTWYT